MKQEFLTPTLRIWLPWSQIPRKLRTSNSYVGEAVKWMSLPGDELAHPASCRWLGSCRQRRISDTYVSGLVFLPEPERTDLGGEDSGPSEGRTACHPKSSSTTGSVLEEQPKRSFLTQTESCWKSRKWSQDANFSQELSSQTFSLVSLAYVRPVSYFSLKSHPLTRNLWHQREEVSLDWGVGAPEGGPGAGSNGCRALKKECECLGLIPWTFAEITVLTSVYSLRLLLSPSPTVIKVGDRRATGPSKDAPVPDGTTGQVRGQECVRESASPSPPLCSSWFFLLIYSRWSRPRSRSLLCLSPADSHTLTCKRNLSFLRCVKAQRRSPSFIIPLFLKTWPLSVASFPFFPTRN